MLISISKKKVCVKINFRKYIVIYSEFQLAEHSSGITEEPQPDLTTMTIGSEISISEAFNKTEDLSESSDSLKSFEKHEMSETDSASTSHFFEDDSLRGMQNNNFYCKL